MSEIITDNNAEISQLEIQLLKLYCPGLQLKDEEILKWRHTQCGKCPKKLSLEETSYYLRNPRYDFTIVCSLHWCQCMPNSVPYDYFTECNRCDRGICRGCKYTDRKGNLICGNCI